MDRVDKLLQDLAPGVDFTQRIGQPVRLPEEVKDKEGSPKASAAFVKPSPPRDPRQPASSVLPTDPAERTAFITQMGGAEAKPQESHDHHGDSDDEDDAGSYHEEEIAFVSTRTMKTEDGTGIEVCFDHNEEEHSSASPNRGTASNGTTAEPASFIGNSSNFHLIPALEKMNPSTDQFTQASARDRWKSTNDDSKTGQKGLRPMYWSMPKCLVVDPLNEPSATRDKEHIAECWPEPDLEQKLIDAYFAAPHHSYPLLNEAIFRKELKDPARRADEDCLMVALSVFALASRYVDDDRVLDPTVKDDDIINTRGVKWFNACRRLGYHLIWPSPTLGHIQSMLLAVIYINGTPLAHTLGWSLLGLIIRMLQATGAHRKVTASCLRFPVHIEESWRRLWWTTYMIDRESATCFGRPMAIQDEDFDTEKPREIDDEVLAMGRNSDGQTPMQPHHQPSFLSAFVCGLKLDEILGRTLRTIYAIAKAKASRGVVGKGWDQLIVAEIDSALNNWLDEVPAHLRYNPDEQSDAWLVQSTLLYSKYYYCQILVHRPFIAGPRTSSSLNFPSLAITTNAARSSIQMIWTLHQKGLLGAGGSAFVFRTFEAGCVLLLVGWGSKKTGHRPSNSSMMDIQRCLTIMQSLEKTWVLAGRLGDLLRVLFQGLTKVKVDGFSISAGGENGDPRSGQDASNGAPVLVTINSTVKSNRQERNRATSGTKPLPLSTQDLGATPSSDSNAALTHSAPSPAAGAPEVSNAWPDPFAVAANESSAGAASNTASITNDPQQRFSNPFAELLPRTASIGGNGGDVQFGSPLDMPSFASALFGTSGTPGNFFGTQNSSMLTPGAQNYFPGSGLPGSSMDSGYAPSRGMFGDQPPPPDSGMGPSNGTAIQGQEGQFMGYPSNGSAMPPPPPGRGSMSQNQPQQQQQQQQQGVTSTGDPFGDIFRDLWTAQELFASDANTANHFHF